jgi:hypothetical protein
MGVITQPWWAVFFDKNYFSLGRSHLKRRSVIDDELAAQFGEDVQECIKLPAGMKLPAAPKNLTPERFGYNSKWERQSNMTKIETPHNIV